MSAYCLVVAGEASGDLLGKSVVTALCAQGFGVKGSGGALMQGVGLNPLIPFADLGVSGTWDVLFRIFTLRRHLNTLKIALRSADCVALYCIDYPGFNMPLMKLAKSLGKPVFWVAPPQIWAWKSSRARYFKGIEVALLFPFEKEAYQKAEARVTLVTHPLIDLHPSNIKTKTDDENSFVEMGAVFPGSRWPQVYRNLPWIKSLIRVLKKRHQSLILVAADSAQQQKLIHIFRADEIQVLCRWELNSLQMFSWAICTPGTVTLDLALARVPCQVLSRIDWLTYAFAKIFISAKWLALPNLILNKTIVPESYCCWPDSPKEKQLESILTGFANQDSSLWKKHGLEIQSMLQGQCIADWVNQHRIQY